MTCGTRYTVGVSGAVRVSREVLDAMLAEARRAGDLECCGLLAGCDADITHSFPAANALASATRFEIDPKELFRILRQMREAGLEHLGTYHSHPRGPETPSATDIEHCYYPEAAYFIIAGNSVRAFHIASGAFTELKIQLLPERAPRCAT